MVKRRKPAYYNKVVVRPVGAVVAVNKLHYIARENIKVTDDVVCETTKGWIKAVVISIEETDVSHSDNNKRIMLLKDYNNGILSDIKEDNEMTDLCLFNVVQVTSRGKYMQYCRTSLTRNELPIGTKVVFTGTDGFEHVGLISNFAEASTVTAGMYSAANNAYIVAIVDSAYGDADKAKAATYKDIISKLNTKRKQLESIAVYEYLADKDPEAKQLLDELKSMISNKEEK